MIIYNEDEDNNKRLFHARERLDVAMMNFKSMPCAMYFQDLYEAMLSYQEIRNP